MSAKASSATAVVWFVQFNSDIVAHVYAWSVHERYLASFEFIEVEVVDTYALLSDVAQFIVLQFSSVGGGDFSVSSQEPLCLCPPVHKIWIRRQHKLEFLASQSQPLRVQGFESVDTGFSNRLAFQHRRFRPIDIGDSGR